MTSIRRTMGNFRFAGFSAMIAAVLLCATPLFAAKYAGEFLYLGVGGRPLALGGAYAAERGDILSGYYNPAGLASLDHSQAFFMHSETFGSLLNHDYIAYAKPIGGQDRPATIGISLYRLGGGGIIVTGQDQTGRFYQVREESHADYVGTVSYGRQFGHNLLGGISAKLIYRNIVDESAYGLGLDIGALYSPANWIDLGLNLQDASTTLLSYSTGKKESVYPTAKFGLKLRGERGRFSAAVFSDADMRFEGRDYSAQFSAGRTSLDTHVGLELSYLERIAARIGSDTGNLTLGAGLHFDRFMLDVAMRDHSDLDNSILVSLTANF